MSHQDAKQTARQVIADLLERHPPGFVIMVLRELKTILRATKDITIFANQTAGKSKHATNDNRHP